MKAYKMTSRCPDVCKIEEIDVVKMTKARVYLSDNRWKSIKGKDTFGFFCIEYFRTKDEALKEAAKLAENFLGVSKENLADAERNLQILLDEQLPSLFDRLIN